MNDSNLFLVLAFDHPTRAVESVADRMAAGLCTLGFDAAAVSLPRDAAKLAKLPPGQVCGVLSMGPMPLSVRFDGRPLWEHFRCPMSIYLLDAVLYDMARVPAMGEFLAAARGDARLGLVAPETGYREWLGEMMGVHWDHLPFAAFPGVRRGLRAGPAAGAPEVLARVAVIGTIGNELGGTPAGETLPELLQRVAGGLASGAQLARLHDALLAAGADAMPALTVARELGWDADRALDRASLTAFVAVDSWVKRDRRIQAVASLAGMPVDFYGTGWREILGDVPGFNHVGRVRHDDIARVLEHYRVAVNFDPNWDGGMHDRVYTAAAMGTHVVSNANTGFATAGLPADLVTTYDATRPRLAALVQEYRLLEAGEPTGARLDVLARHNWGSRMAQWLSEAPLAGAAAAPHAVELAAPARASANEHSLRLAPAA